MNVTERREQPGGTDTTNEDVAVLALNKDAMQSESVVSSSLPASYGAIMQNKHTGRASHATNSNIATSRVIDNCKNEYFSGNHDKGRGRDKIGASRRSGPIHSAHIKQSISAKKNRAKTNSQKRNTSEEARPTDGRRFVKASSVANVMHHKIYNNTSQNVAMASLQVNQVGSMHQLKKAKLDGASELIASERVLSNAVADSQNVPDWHPMPSAFDVNKESIGATL